MAYNTIIQVLNTSITEVSVDDVTNTSLYAPSPYYTELATGAIGLPGPQGPQGNQGIQGIQGEQGIQGDQGDAATINVGTTTTGSPGSSASVTNSGSTSAAVFNFTIPRGDVGATGATGQGVVTGGTTGQVLAKASNTNYDTQWVNAGTGTVTSVGLTAPTGLTVSNSPVTTSGNIALTYTAGYSIPTTTSQNTWDNAIQSITSTDGSVIVTPTGTTSDLSVAVSGSTTNVICLVRNNTGATLTKGTAVYINGAIGQNPTVAKALATSDATSAQTLGLMTADLANNSNGYVTIIGLITNINTSAYTDGQQLYLSPTTAGTLTATKPHAPQHLVYAAVVEHAHPTQGKLFVKVQNGYEMDELHNVSAQTPSNGDVLIWNNTTSLWESQSLTSGTGISIGNGAGSITVTNTAPDQTVALTGAGTTSITGTYPNFTITSNDAYTGTVTSVTGTSPISSTGGTTPAISLAASYGDTQNPYASKTANYVLAAPNGSAGVPTFRAIVAADIPTLNQNTTGTASNVTGTVAIANGGTGKTTANAAMANLMGFTSTATAAGTTTLDNTSSYYQLFTGTTTQTVVLPVTSTLQAGWTFHICNNSTGTVTVQSSGLNTVLSVIAGTTVMCTCIGTTLTTAADWEAGFTDFSTVTGSSGSVVLSGAPSLIIPSFNSPTATGTLSFSGSTTLASNFHTTQTSGVMTIGGTAGTGNIIVGRSTVSQQTDIQAGATASGSTKTINFGSGGLAGSTTAITIGSTAGTSTTTLNGTTTLANALAVTSGGTGGTSIATAQTNLQVDPAGTAVALAIALG